jgi:hypothetical protein
MNTGGAKTSLPCSFQSSLGLAGNKGGVKGFGAPSLFFDHLFRTLEKKGTLQALDPIMGVISGLQDMDKPSTAHN